LYVHIFICILYYERLVLFVLQAVLGNLRASRNLESISLSRGGDNKRQRHEFVGATLKIEIIIFIHQNTW